MSSLFRITSLADWQQALVGGVLPRCAADVRDNCVHLNAGEDVETVAAAFFGADEHPVALELDCSLLTEFVTWLPASQAKPWPQARLNLPNVITSHVLSVKQLIPINRNGTTAFRLAAGAG